MSILVKSANARNPANKNFEDDITETSPIEIDSKKYENLRVRSRELGVNENLNYDRINELIEKIEKT